MTFDELKEKFDELSWEQLFAIVAGVIFAVFVIITIAGFATGKASFGGNLRKADPTPQAVLKDNPQSRVFDLIGQIRAPTRTDSHDKHAVVVILPWLEYDGEDKVFYEELDKKLNGIKAVFYEYVSGRTEQQLKNRGEAGVKSDLLALVNEKLVLGKIKGIYFKDYEFVK